MSSHSRRGSILVFSLIILSFMLVSALSIAAVSVTERRSASTTDKSTRSFQVADTGVEKVLQKIYKGSYATPSDLATAVGGSCASGVISAATTSGSFTVSLYDNSNAQIACTDTAWRDNATKLRSEGTSGNTTRAVEVAVAAPSSVPPYLCIYGQFNGGVIESGIFDTVPSIGGEGVCKVAVTKGVWVASSRGTSDRGGWNDNCVCWKLN